MQIKFGVGESFRSVDPDSGCCTVQLVFGQVDFLGRGQVGAIPNGWHYIATTKDKEECVKEIIDAGGLILHGGVL